MKYFMVTAKCGHVGKNCYYKGTFFVYEKDKKAAASLVRNMPRVKHDRKDAILDVREISQIVYEAGCELNQEVHYYSCESVQEQRLYMGEIENNIFQEEDDECGYFKEKKHSLRNYYNDDPDWKNYKDKKLLDIA